MCRTFQSLSATNSAHDLFQFCVIVSCYLSCLPFIIYPRPALFRSFSGPLLLLLFMTVSVR